MAICLDSEQFMWFGSADGLNLYDGTSIQIFKPSSNKTNSLSGNMIDGIMEAQPGILWVATNYGFNKLNKYTREVECHREFEGLYKFTKNVNNEVFVILEDDKIEYYNEKQHKFVSCPYKGVVKKNISSFFIDKSNILWLFFQDGNVLNARIETDGQKLKITPLNDFEHEFKINNCYYKNGRVFFIDSENNLFELETNTRRKHFVKNISLEIAENGTVSDIIKDNDDYLVAFLTNGVIRLKHTPERERKYESERINIYCGVFALLKDEAQDVIWIGTDGQGVYMYSHESFSIRCTTFNDLPRRLQKPIRALHLDRYNNLWIGTKGEGIVRIREYETDRKVEASKIDQLTNSNSSLINNSNYKFLAEPQKEILWIGGDGPGLNFYSYKELRIKPVPSSADIPVFHVHDMCKTNDTTLWIATGGWAILKAIITWDGRNEPRIKSIKNIRFTKQDKMTNHFFSICQENDSILWFGNRRHGALRMNVETEKYDFVRFDGQKAETINDVLCIHKDKKGNIWFGSSYGITRLYSFDKKVPKFDNYNEKHGLPNNTIHSILEDKNGNLWLSTNSGIVEFNPTKKTFKTYGYQDGIEVIEFSDGASFQDSISGTMFFGGRNGLVSIKQDQFTKSNFVPLIFFTGIRIYENACNLFKLMKEDNDGKYLELKHDQNFFAITFVALDYINGQNNRYSYNLENFNDKWIDNGHANSVSFTNIPPGEYFLHVKCSNATSGEYGDSFTMKIIILPPWYLTVWAYLIYAVVFILGSYFLVKLGIKRYYQKKGAMLEKMNQQQKEELYESKLRFFTNITHEFSTPLTLIYGPCDRIITYNGSDGYIKKYASLIMKNTERLNLLIQELIEFRRIETGHKTCKIETINISELAGSITDSFQELAESKSIEFIISIEENIIWNSDKSSFIKIFSNLISNAFKYTPNEGIIEINLCVENGHLELNVSNTGKGIKETELIRIFDRYSMLENFEKQSGKGITSRNGLGLAICHNLVKLLEGEISVKSIPGEITVFTVSLPEQEITEEQSEDTAVNENNSLQSIPDFLHEKENNEISITSYQLGESEHLKSRPTILVVDDDPEILWFVSEIFTEQYNIITIENAEKALALLEQTQPDLVISDIMMPGMDGIAFTKKMKTDKRVSHIPLIILSAKSTPEDQVEGMEAGAEIYVTKPFNVEYIKSVVERLIQRQNDLKEYYNSTMSAFEISKGQLVHKDDKIFFDKMLKIIEENIADPSFSTEKLATELCVSTRHLYRKLATITNQTPGELIKEYRLTLVEKLLVSTKLSIDEIMHKTGYSNRGNFYKVFSGKYDMTPKNYREKRNNELS